MNKTLPALGGLLMAAFLLHAQVPSTDIPGEPTLPTDKPTGTPVARYSADGAPPLNEKDMRGVIDFVESDGKSIVHFANENVEKGFKPPTTNVKKQGQSNENNGTTEITAKVGAFDQNNHVAVFTTEVYVENPQFTVNCDKLTAYMHVNEVKMEEREETAKARAAAKAVGVNPEPGKPNIPATPRPAPKATPIPRGAKVKIDDGATSKNASQAERDAVVTPAKVAVKSSGGLEEAVCEGSVVVIQDKIDPDGTVTRNIGHGRKAVYYADSGDICLLGSPDVQQGVNTCVAMEDSCVIILNRDGHMTANGLHRTIIKDSSQDTNNANNAQE
jgi:lipopolysaccharide export system protein LptA